MSTLLGPLGNWLSGRAQNTAAQSRARLYNDWLAKRGNASDSILAQLQANGQNPFGPQTHTSRMSGSSSSDTMPVITAQYQPLESSLRSIVQGRLNSPSSLPQGYAENAVRGINESYAGQQSEAQNLAARNGLSGVQAAALASASDRPRAGQIADLRGNLPLLERQMQNEDIGLGQALTQAFGRGEHTNSRFSQSGETTGPADIASLMALLGLNNGPMASEDTGYSPWGSAAQQGGQWNNDMLQIILGALGGGGR